MPDNTAARFRHSGHKVTPQRLAIAEVIINCTECLTPATLFDRVKKLDPQVGLVTVYRTLSILAELGLICEVHLPDGSHGYTGRPPEHHDHLICSGCGKVVNFTKCNIADLEQRLSSETGFSIREHHLEFFGRCGNCKQHSGAGN